MNKTLIDTNILIRLIAEDVASQQKIAKDIFIKIENKKLVGIISVLVIHEFINITINYYKKSKLEVINYILKLISFKNIEILEISKNETIKIINDCLKLNIDFTDAYLLWKGKTGNYKVSSFDKKLLKNS